MIQRELIEKLVSDVLTDEFFIISISVKQGNVIEVIIDGDNGVAIQKCVEVSRNVEQHLDRETDDFELSVFSAGLGNPFIVHRQYLKNIGKDVEVKVGGEKITGILKNVDNEGFEIEAKLLVKEEGKKKKVEIVKLIRYNFTDQPEVKNCITFK